jgi:hypothetical protein
MEHSGETSNVNAQDGKKTRRSSPNHRWTQEQSKALIEFLVEQVMLGMKVPKSFKPTAFKAAADHIGKTFNLRVTIMQVKNHYRVLKQRLKDIRAALMVSGAGWDNATKTITFEKETIEEKFQVYIRECDC